MKTTEPIKTGEKLAYGFGCFGQNMIYNFMANFLLFFYTDIFGLIPSVAGTILLLAKLWDAVNDPMMGMLADRTRTRWGKFRPYLITTPILFVPFAVATFSAPSFSMGGKIAWAATTYICFGMIYTASDVPFWALSSAITNDTNERNSVVVYPRFVATVAVAIATLSTQPLIKLFSAPDNPDRGYQLTALAYGLLTAACFAMTFFFVKERVRPTNKERATFKDIVKTFAVNKPLLLVIVSGFFTGIGQTAKLSMLIYYAKYNLGNEMLYTLFAGANIPFILIGISTVPFFCRHFGKKATCIGYYAIYALGSLGFYFTGWHNFGLLLAFNCFSSLGMASPQVIQTAMIADTIEYGELKTGKRTEGTIFSSQTFLAKLTAAVTSVMIAASLSKLGYVPNATQAPQVLSGIHAMTAFIPFFASLLGIIPIVFYPLDEKRHAQIVKTLQERAASLPD
jgi:GPH family glycoside/pentoside/hexuronide:cation symporter/probable glucitol transport protein GutA